MNSSSGFSSWQAQKIPSHVLGQDQLANYVQPPLRTPRIRMPVVSMPIASHQPLVLGSVPFPSHFRAVQNVAVQPTVPTLVRVEDPTVFQNPVSGSLPNNLQHHHLDWTNTSNSKMDNNKSCFLNTVPISSNTDKLFLNPEAKQFTPTKNSEILSVRAAGFQPQNIFLPHTSQSQPLSQDVGIAMAQSPSLHVVVPTAGAAHSDQAVNTGLSTPSSTTMRTSIPPVNNQPKISTESQTRLFGADLDTKLCEKCRENLFGQESQGVGPNLRLAPTLLKIKDISMQHKLKYLAIKAAVFVRESPTILSQPQELKTKLLNRLIKMCSHFGAETQPSISWQDDMACSVAVNLLTEEPGLSSAPNGGKFLQQLKGELESQLEIAQDILNQEKENVPISDAAQAKLEKALDTEATHSKIETMSVSDKSSLLNVDIPNIGSSSNDRQTDLVSNIGHAIPNLQANSLLCDNAVGSKEQLGFMSNVPASYYGLQADVDSSSSPIALNSNIPIFANVPIACAVPSVDAKSLNVQMAPLLDHSVLDYNPIAATNLLNNSSQSDASQELLKMQQKYIEMLNFNILNRQSSANSFSSGELSSDKFVSQISQSMVDFKLDSDSPSELSPSLSVEDDISVTLSSSGHDRVRHLSSSTSNSDSDQKTLKRKPLHHGKELTGPVGAKKMAPLDFRRPKQSSEGPTSDLESQLSALYLSVTSQEDTSVCKNTFEHKSDTQLRKEETAGHTALKPMRRMTPLQRKLLKKNEQNSSGGLARDVGAKSIDFQPKTVKVDYQLGSLQPCGDNASWTVQNEASFRPETCVEWRKTTNPFISADGDASIVANLSGMSPISSSESEFMKRLKSKKLLHEELDQSKLGSNTESESSLRTITNPFIRARGDDTISTTDSGFSDFSSISRSESDFVKRSKSNQLLNTEPLASKTMGIPEKQTCNSHRADSIDIRTLRVIGEELARDLPCQTSACKIVNDQAQKINLLEEKFPVSKKICEAKDEAMNYEPCNSKTKGSSPSSDNQMSDVTLIREFPSSAYVSDIPCKVNQIDVDNNLTFPPIPSTISIPVVTCPSSIPGVEDDSKSGNILECSSFQSQSYSDVVKQKPIQKSFQIPKFDDNNNNNDRSQDSIDLHFRHEITSDFVVSGIESKNDSIIVDPVPISSYNNSSSGPRTWSSLFDSKDKMVQQSSTHREGDGKDKCKAVLDGVDSGASSIKDEEEESGGSNIGQSHPRFGMYGLDDFNSTPPSLKVVKTTGMNKEEGADTRVEEQKSSNLEESDWKVVTKKPKKAIGTNQDMETLLKTFRTENQYTDLCQAVTEKNPGISKQTVEDVLETVFVEMGGLADLDEWEILEEIDVALAQMCPQELTGTAGMKVEKSRGCAKSDETSEIKSNYRTDKCPFQ